MSITNGYLTLAEFKRRFRDIHTYTAATLSFTASTKTIADTAFGLHRFQAGDHVQISGAGQAGNNGLFTVVTGNVDGSLVVSESLTNESAGASVTVAVIEPTDDAVIEQVVEDVSRAVDDICGRTFYAATQTRVFTPTNARELIVGDLLTVTTLKTDQDGDRVYETTWATTDFDLGPENAPYLVPPSAYYWISVAPQGRYSFPLGVRTVEIVGSWGAAATVPGPVREATLIQAIRLYKRKDAPFGVMGSAEMGQLQVLPKLDPDVKLLLNKYIRAGFA